MGHIHTDVDCAVESIALNRRIPRGLALSRPVTGGRLVPVVLAGVAIAAQIVYPHFDGTSRDVMTILTVVVFAAASLSHAWAEHGLRTACHVAAILAGGGMLVEVLGVSTGFPFGSYIYSDRIGPAIGEVPLIIPLAWSMLGYPALVVARLTTGRRWTGTAVGAAALAAWDLFLDPQMVAEGYWTWDAAGPHLIGSIPFTNYLAWLGIAWLMMMAMWPLTRDWDTTTQDHRVPVALYVWTWFGSMVAHFFYLGLPQSGLYGGIGMGAVVAVFGASLARSGRTIPPDGRGHTSMVLSAPDLGGHRPAGGSP